MGILPGGSENSAFAVFQNFESQFWPLRITQKDARFFFKFSIN